MKRILITGATGNVGVEVIRYLVAIASTQQIVAGVRDIEKAKRVLHEFPTIMYVTFDFEAPETYSAALQGIDQLFLLRPPHLSDVNRYFKPLLSEAKAKHIKEILFLSVQGAEKSSVIPHNKIERLIRANGFRYIFLRPGYFMQNLTTTLLPDIRHKQSIALPAGDAVFNWIDIKNIGEVAALLLTHFEHYKDTALEITGSENENFHHVASLLSDVLKSAVIYHNVNPIRFFLSKKREGMKTGMILVMTLLHFIPRFQPAPRRTDLYQQLTGKKPTELRAFIQREKSILMTE